MAATAAPDPFANAERHPFWLVKPQITGPRERALEVVRIMTGTILLQLVQRKEPAYLELAQLAAKQPPLTPAEVVDAIARILPRGLPLTLEYIAYYERRMFMDWRRHTNDGLTQCAKSDEHCKNVSAIQRDSPEIIATAIRACDAWVAAQAPAALNAAAAQQAAQPTPQQMAHRSAQTGTGVAVAPAPRVTAALLGLSTLPTLFGEAPKRAVFGANHVFLNVLAASGAAPSAWHGATPVPAWAAAQAAKGNRAAVAAVERQLRAYDDAIADRAAGERAATAGADLRRLPTLQRDLAALQREAYAAAESELLACRRVDEHFKRSGASSVAPAGSRSATAAAPPAAGGAAADLPALLAAAGSARELTGALRARVVTLGDRVRDILRAVQLDWRDAGVCSSGGGGLGVRMRMAAHSRRALLWPHDALAAAAGGFDPQTGRESPAQGPMHWLPSVGLRSAQETALLARLAAPPAAASEATPGAGAGGGAAADPQLLDLAYSSAPGAPAGAVSACAYAHDVVSVQLLNVLAGVMAVARARQFRTLQGLRALRARAVHWVPERSADPAATTAAAAAAGAAAGPPGRPMPPLVVMESRDTSVHSKWLATVDAWAAAFVRQRETVVRRALGLAHQVKALATAAAVPGAPPNAAARAPHITVDANGWPSAPPPLAPENAATLAQLHERLILDECHRTCQRYYTAPLEELVKVANTRGGLVTVLPGEFMPAPAPPVAPPPDERLAIPPSLRRDLSRVLAVDAAGYVFAPAEVDALLRRVADARLRVTLEDVQDYFADQLLSRTPGAGSHALAAEVTAALGDDEDVAYLQAIEEGASADVSPPSESAPSSGAAVPAVGERGNVEEDDPAALPTGEAPAAAPIADAAAVETGVTAAAAADTTHVEGAPDAEMPADIAAAETGGAAQAEDAPGPDPVADVVSKRRDARSGRGRKVAAAAEAKSDGATADAPAPAASKGARGGHTRSKAASKAAAVAGPVAASAAATVTEGKSEEVASAPPAVAGVKRRRPGAEAGGQQGDDSGAESGPATRSGAGGAASSRTFVSAAAPPAPAPLSAERLRALVVSLRRAAAPLGSHPRMRALLRWALARAGFLKAMGS